MTSEDRTRFYRAPGCLCVLCGLPASGKSTLTRTVLSRAAQHGWRATVVPYDELIPRNAFKTKAVQDNEEMPQMHTDWKLHRHAVLQCIDQFLKTREEVVTEPASSCHINTEAWERCVRGLMQSGYLDHALSDQSPMLFLLDDNFYYPSMRYEVYQLARKYSLGFCQVYLHCDLKTCIGRNQNRAEPVPTEVILDMEKRLEFPNPQKNLWEKQSLSLDTTDKLTSSDIQKMIQLISSSLKNPLSPIEDSSEQREADRLKCATSVVHQADQACRRLISEAMKTARENHVSPERMRFLAAQLGESKAVFLRNLRENVLQEMELTQGEDIDVERVVKRAVDVFDRSRKELLETIVCPKYV
ncbi:L-seryl-tRNA(Sec) kinase [Cynoglossus semilaevis]|uniref:Phosphoseryl-tRNA kinase n=1 Tax=Cynoglossus semilaevis TaxID=244447 RepID=A0A3P8WRY6_CYNSE|nr:L-seryl-tRNA(Sec) kinase [Cynoglossus semilaevis]